MRRTYRSKKENGGCLDPRDVILAMDSKSSVFDAFYINNIKQTKRDLSIGPSVQFAASNRVRKRKYVKRLKEQEPVIRESGSTTAFLTPDKSFRVNKAPDLFDQLLNSTIEGPKVETVKHISNGSIPKGRTYCKHKSLKKQKINYSSGDSTDSEKENSASSIKYNTTQNTSDVLSHKLLIEKEYEKSLHCDESIAEIVNNLSLFKESKDNISTSPRCLSTKSRHSCVVEIAQNSPLCSTPFVEKYRGKSIYNFSPISINLNDSPNSINITKEHLEKNKEDSSVILVKDELVPEFENVEEIKQYTFNANKQKSINDNNVSHELQSSQPAKTATFNTSKSCHNSLAEQNDLLETTELEPFLGFSNSEIPNSMKLKSISSKCNQFEKDISILNPPIEVGNNSSSSLNETKTETSSVREIENNTSTEKISPSNSNLESDENGSLYDTCNSEDFDDDEETYNKQALVMIERLNDSIFKKYYHKMPFFSDHSINETNTSLSDDPFSDEYASLDENKSESDNDISKRKNILQEDSLNKGMDEQGLDSDNSSDSNKPEEEVFMSFVTTRRRNEVTNDSFIFSLDNSMTSGSSGDIDKTVLSKDNVIECVQNNDETLMENGPVETNVEFQNVSSNNLTAKEEIDVIEKYTETEFIHSPKAKNNCISITNGSVSRPSFKTRKSSYSTTIKPRVSLKANVNIDSGLIDKKIMTRRSSRLNRGSFDVRKSSLKPESISPKNRTESRSRDLTLSNVTMIDPKQGIVLQPGKRWERSLSIYRRMTTMADHFDHSILDDEPLNTKGRKYRQSVISTMEMQDLTGSLHNESINSRRSTFVSKPSRSTIRIVRDSDTSRASLGSTSVFEESQGFLTEDCDDTIVELSKLSIADSEHEVTVLEKFHDTSNRFATARDYVLRRCNQTDVILFDECYPDTVLKNCRKIGEGVYGEVFLWRAGDGRARVLKIVPIAGNIKVNGENQKDYHEIISEIVIAMELSGLRAPIAEIEKHFNEGKSVETLDLHSVENATDVFNEVLAVRCVYGSYPSRLLDLWDLYDECKGSENDNPAILPVDQQYIVLELANAGQDLESYQFTNAEQAYALFKQVAFGLAVAEEAYQFEHRDLHWGNVLISPTDQKFATFVVRGRAFRVARRGVAGAVIDYSLSRAALRLPAGGRAELYNDLAADDGLFDAVGDYQFEVYRLMREKLGNDWKNFEPYTNILWLHYTVDKMITSLRYTRTNTKIHKHYIAKLKEIKNRILDYGSAVQYVLTDNEL
ncbi:uncharacterized protein LOC125066715 isoform X2 [Vanessa atalanta]|uniref:uncharacterized protein LOC125066715 isoform X2 n=1 Tax=Vanessa atalanta TaxID=42275 RepID=UPI001FCDE803|nr:uncharacterized protein LOC125066715 isoform X2 [Vanessa atalanta]